MINISNSPANQATFKIAALTDLALRDVFALYQQYLGGRAENRISASNDPSTKAASIQAAINSGQIVEFRIGSSWSDASKLLVKPKGLSGDSLTAAFEFELNDFNWDVPGIAQTDQRVQEFLGKRRELDSAVRRLLEIQGLLATGRQE